MSGILDLPEARARAMRWSVEIYDQYGEWLADHGILPERAELIRRIIIEKTPRSSLHVHLSKRIYDQILRLAPNDYTVFQEGPLRLADSEPEPDISIVRGTVNELLGANPTTASLVVQIAVSSVAMDREYASLYAEACIFEYWIVLAEAQQIEVRRQPVNGVYQTQRLYGRGETLVCQSVPELAITLDELFAG